MMLRLPHVIAGMMIQYLHTRDYARLLATHRSLGGLSRSCYKEHVEVKYSDSSVKVASSSHGSLFTSWMWPILFGEKKKNETAMAKVGPQRMIPNWSMRSLSLSVHTEETSRSEMPMPTLETCQLLAKCELAANPLCTKALSLAELPSTLHRLELYHSGFRKVEISWSTLSLLTQLRSLWLDSTFVCVDWEHAGTCSNLHTLRLTLHGAVYQEKEELDGLPPTLTDVTLTSMAINDERRLKNYNNLTILCARQTLLSSLTLDWGRDAMPSEFIRYLPSTLVRLGNLDPNGRSIPLQLRSIAQFDVDAPLEFPHLTCLHFCPPCTLLAKMHMPKLRELRIGAVSATLWTQAFVDDFFPRLNLCNVVIDGAVEHLRVARIRWLPLLTQLTSLAILAFPVPGTELELLQPMNAFPTTLRALTVRVPAAADAMDISIARIYQISPLTGLTSLCIHSSHVHLISLDDMWNCLRLLPHLARLAFKLAPPMFDPSGRGHKVTVRAMTSLQELELELPDHMQRLSLQECAALTCLIVSGRRNLVVEESVPKLTSVTISTGIIEVSSWVGLAGLQALEHIHISTGITDSAIIRDRIAALVKQHPRLKRITDRHTREPIWEKPVWESFRHAYDKCNVSTSE